MSKGTRHNRRDNQLSFAVGERGLHEPADAIPAGLLADGASDYSGGFHVESLVGEIHGTGRGERALIHLEFKIFGAGNAVDNGKIARELLNSGQILRIY